MTARLSPEGLAATLKSLLDESGADPVEGGGAHVRSTIQSALVSQPSGERLEYLQKVIQFVLREIPVSGAAQDAQPVPHQQPEPASRAPEAAPSIGDMQGVDAAFRFATMAGGLGIRDAAEVNAERLADLAEMWQGFTVAVDNAVRTVWGEIAKHASEAEAARAPAPAAISRVAASYVRGTGNVQREDVERQLELLRRLISSILMGLAEAGKQRAQEQVRIFAPDAIRNSVRASKHKNLEAECWRQYEMLVKSHHAADIQAVFAGIQQRLADYVIQTLAVASGTNSRG